MCMAFFHDNIPYEIKIKMVVALAIEGSDEEEGIKRLIFRVNEIQFLHGIIAVK